MYKALTFPNIFNSVYSILYIYIAYLKLQNIKTYILENNMFKALNLLIFHNALYSILNFCIVYKKFKKY